MDSSILRRESHAATNAGSSAGGSTCPYSFESMDGIALWSVIVAA
jgi:hypothetical protein